jgi:hypothetical protein
MIVVYTFTVRHAILIVWRIALKPMGVQQVPQHLSRIIPLTVLSVALR